jgi:hypothetical protein
MWWIVRGALATLIAVAGRWVALLVVATLAAGILARRAAIAATGH